MIEALKIIEKASSELIDEMRSADSVERLAQICAVQLFLLSVFDHISGLKRMQSKLALAPYIYYDTERAKRDVLSASVIG
jgi:hypothetical protein